MSFCIYVYIFFFQFYFCFLSVSFSSPDQYVNWLIIITADSLVCIFDFSTFVVKFDLWIVNKKKCTNAVTKYDSECPREMWCCWQIVLDTWRTRYHHIEKEKKSPHIFVFFFFEKNFFCQNLGKLIEPTWQTICNVTHLSRNHLINSLKEDLVYVYIYHYCMEITYTNVTLISTLRNLTLKIMDDLIFEFLKIFVF